MLININITPAELSKISKVEASLLFSEIARSSLEGFHRFFMKRELANWVLENIQLTIPYQAQINHIKSLIIETGAQVDYALCLLTIEIGKTKYISRTDHKGNGHHWQISHKNFIDGMRLDRAFLLTENSRIDRRLFEIAFKYELKKIDFGEIRFQPADGAGSNITGIFEDLLNEENLVLCICDQDYINGKKSLGKKLLNKFEKLKSTNVVGLALLTPCDKIENFLTIEIIDFICESLKKQNMKVTKDCIQCLKHTSSVLTGKVTLDKTLWLNLDIKNGFSGEKVFKKCQQDKELVEWLKENYHITKSEIRKLNYPGFGNNLVKDFLQCTDARGEFESHVNSTIWSEQFGAWFKPIFWFLCGNKRNSISIDLE